MLTSSFHLCTRGTSGRSLLGTLTHLTQWTSCHRYCLMVSVYLKYCNRYTRAPLAFHNRNFGTSWFLSSAHRLARTKEWGAALTYRLNSIAIGCHSKLNYVHEQFVRLRRLPSLHFTSLKRDVSEVAHKTASKRQPWCRVPVFPFFWSSGPN